jgi:hypothetical protein
VSDPLLNAVHQAIMELEVLIELHEDTPTAYLLDGVCNRLSVAGQQAGSREQALTPEQLDARTSGASLLHSVKS